MPCYFVIIIIVLIIILNLLFHFQAIISNKEGSFQEAFDRLKVTPSNLDVIEVQKSRFELPNGKRPEYGMCLLAYAGYYQRKRMIDMLVEGGASKQDAMCIPYHISLIFLLL